MGHDRYFIEETFPVKDVGAESAREKNIRHGHISTLHIWWARRPLASSRATAYAALTPPPESPEEKSAVTFTCPMLGASPASWADWSL